MSEKSLPSASVALGSLRTNGNQFETVPLAPQPIGGVTHRRAERGVSRVAADSRVLAAIGRIYVGDDRLRRSISQRGGRPLPLQTASKLLARHYADDRLVWGVSGFASIGHPCGVEADGLVKLYDYFRKDQRRPSLICDGGAGAGVPGISGVLAAEHGILTLGLVSLQGLASMAPRNHTVVYGQTHRDREVLVGLVPDILVIAGGGDGAEREGLATLRRGGRVLLLSLKDDGPQALSSRWQTVPEMARAVLRGRMIVCRELREIPAFAERLRVAALRAAHTVRPPRLVEFSGKLSV